MARSINRLTTRFIDNIKVPGKYPDGGNLFAQITLGASGTINRSWLFGYELRGVRHMMGLGRYPDDRGLNEARAKAKELRQLLIEGLDPLQERRKRAEEQSVEQEK